VDWRQPFEAIRVGSGRKLQTGEDLAILTIGAIGTQATKAIPALKNRAISAAHYDMRFVKPLDEMLLHEVFSTFEDVLLVEDGCIVGGFGSAVIEFMADNGYQSRVKRLGLPDRYVEHGTQQELYAENGYDTNGIIETAVLMMEQKNNRLASAQNAG
jgi:1-deoxy-D-xylulose-5-phosphate synthase